MHFYDLEYASKVGEQGQLKWKAQLKREAGFFLEHITESVAELANARVQAISAW